MGEDGQQVKKIYRASSSKKGLSTSGSCKRQLFSSIVVAVVVVFSFVCVCVCFQHTMYYFFFMCVCVFVCFKSRFLLLLLFLEKPDMLFLDQIPVPNLPSPPPFRQSTKKQKSTGCRWQYNSVLASLFILVVYCLFLFLFFVF